MHVLSEVSWDSVLLLLFEVSVFLFSWECEGFTWHSRHWRRLQLSFVFIVWAFLNYLIFLLLVTICVVVSLGTELGNQAVTGSQLGCVSLSHYLCDTCVFSTSPEISGRCEQRTAIVLFFFFPPTRSSGGCFALGARARIGAWICWGGGRVFLAFPSCWRSPQQGVCVGSVRGKGSTGLPHISGLASFLHVPETCSQKKSQNFAELCLE